MEDTETEDVGELVQDLKVNLENRGVLANIRAQLRAAVFDVMREVEAPESKEQAPSLKAVEMKKTPEGELMVELIRDFLSHCGCLLTLSMFKSEVGLQGNPASIDELCNNSGFHITAVVEGEPRILGLLRGGGGGYGGGGGGGGGPSAEASGGEEEAPGGGDPLDRTFRPGSSSRQASEMMNSGTENLESSKEDISSSKKEKKKKKKSKKDKDKERDKKKKVADTGEAGASNMPTLGTLSGPTSEGGNKAPLGPALSLAGALPPPPAAAAAAAAGGGRGRSRSASLELTHEDGFGSPPGKGESAASFSKGPSMDSPHELSDSFAQSSAASLAGGGALSAPPPAPLAPPGALGGLEPIRGSKGKGLKPLGGAVPPTAPLGKLSKLDGPPGGGTKDPFAKAKLPTRSTSKSQDPDQFDASISLGESFESNSNLELSMRGKFNAADLRGLNQKEEDKNDNGSAEISQDLSDMSASVDELNKTQRSEDETAKLQDIEQKLKQMEQENPSLRTLRKDEDKSLNAQRNQSLGWEGGQEEEQNDQETLTKSASHAQASASHEDSYNDDDIEFVESPNLKPGRRRGQLDPMNETQHDIAQVAGSAEGAWGQTPEKDPKLPKKDTQVSSKLEESDGYGSEDFEDYEDDFENSKSEIHQENPSEEVNDQEEGNITEEQTSVGEGSLELSVSEAAVGGPAALADRYAHVEDVRF